MREAARRTLWIIPTLLLVSVAAFWAVSRGAADARDAHLPVLLNAEPPSCDRIAREAARAVAGGDEAAKRTLASMGGAALPHLLPELDALEPLGRGRVAVALGPVAERMGLVKEGELDTPERAVAFWTRFWQDRSVDFRPSVVKRAVRRHAERPSAQRLAELRELDTFAVGEIVAVLPNRVEEVEVSRVRRLAGVLAHATGNEWTVPETATPAVALDVAARWRDFWLRNRTRFEALDSLGRVGAIFTETQYARWLGGASRGTPARIGRSAPTTIILCALGWLAGYLVGIGLAVAEATTPVRIAQAALGVTLGAVASTPALVLVELMPGASFANAALAMIVVGAGVVSRHHVAAQTDETRAEWVRTEIAKGASRLRVAVTAVKPASGPAITLAVTDLPAIASAAFVVEHAFGLHGLSSETIRAVRERDVAWLMSLVLCGATSVALLQIIIDRALRSVDPRVRLGRARRMGHE